LFLNTTAFVSAAAALTESFFLKIRAESAKDSADESPE